MPDRIQCGQCSGWNYRGQPNEHNTPTKIYRHRAGHLERFRIQFQEGQSDGRQIAASRD